MIGVPGYRFEGPHVILPAQGPRLSPRRCGRSSWTTSCREINRRRRLDARPGIALISASYRDVMDAASERW